MSRKILFLTVADFPFHYGEPFLEDELAELAHHFDEIHIIVTSYKLSDSKKLVPLFKIPENVRIHFADIHLSFFEKLFLIEILNGSLFWEALNTLRTKFGQKVTLYKLKLISSYIKRAKKYANHLKTYVQKNIAPGDTLLFYTYWLSECTLGNILLKSEFPGSRAVSRAHGWDVYFERNRESYLPFRPKIISRLDALFLISEHGLKYLQNKLWFADPINLYVSRLGTQDLSPGSLRFLESESKKGISILTLAFISPVKRMDLAVQVVNYLLEKNIPVHWTHIGNGASLHESRFLAEVERLKERHKSLDFVFEGLKTKSEIREILESRYFDLLLNTSDYEGLPVSMMEAMSAGIPCVGRDVGGVQEIIVDGYNGYLCSNSPEPSELAEKIISYVKMPAASKNLMHQNARKTWKEKFNAESNYRSFAENLTHILDSDPGYRACRRCVYNTENCPEINIDFNQLCFFCRIYDLKIARIRAQKTEGKVEYLKKEIQRHRGPYNCIIGVSGGVDSTYTAYVVKKILGLRPLAVHLDNGWNSELAVLNIRNCLEALDIDLFTYVIDWEEFKDLQRAYLKASVVDIEVLTDHAILATLYRAAVKYKIPYIISGENFSTEGLLPRNWVFNKNDLINIKAIHKRFGSRPIKTFPKLGLVRKYFWDKFYKIKYIPILDYFPYDKKAAKEIISKELGWREYGGKHHESTFTKLYQTVILPEKFGIDKRVAHFSTLICAGQMTREEALQELEKPVIEPKERESLIRFACEKFEFTREEWEEIMKAEPVPHTFYPSTTRFIEKLKGWLVV
ncbi:MAG: N-acetyl sugar amidotransferase [Flavobacteriales bacterium]|nr:N-acetyl sugar amidotransferase [Flavobacteriales bacterium]MDW8431274.1 N-acetyl sugar amidotransferase [Flavobacteriales bacterium]